MNFISTCVSFNEEPIALFEIFQKVTDKNYVKDSVSFHIESGELPPAVVARLKDTQSNRINYY